MAQGYAWGCQEADPEEAERKSLFIKSVCMDDNMNTQRKMNKTHRSLVEDTAL